jgi:molybdopterin/thiamine biosynthesis adenylyltransferase
MELSSGDMRRYSRQIILPEIGINGQTKIRQASVLCIGAGGLGCPVALYLAAAGVGTLGLVDFDVVDLSNLQRQVLHGTPDVGRPKRISAREALLRLNPGSERSRLSGAAFGGKRAGDRWPV